ncbi:hypothetical protein N7492_000259 [Penicillium capsulatum]|uniref:HPP transmembrane region domain-containing protein n=1 Tax=Penicillium capsulatum TaxID=69766 RepID=A0A9W9IQX3_9EURO|nr:hypothetical protein N7492_000259 [Penicillium capsulatum]KAJ6130675.1 hypothetical protein N7512_003455 [Penicillium capsulatum]
MVHSSHGSGALTKVASWNLDIDRFMNPFIPAPRWHLFPRPVAHFLGHRESSTKPIGNVLTACWALVGAFCGVALIASVSERIPSFKIRDSPPIIGSFGAAAVIEFCAIESPFAQPRNAFFSQMWACLIGVGISKLFALNPHAEQYTELGGALACGLTTAAMALTGTIHPPAGATALLAVTNSQTAGLGWFLFPVMILGVTLMQVAALLINNIQRRFPLYWWTAQSLAREKSSDVEKDRAKEAPSEPSHYEDSLPDNPPRLVVQRGEITIPDGVYISADEWTMLRRISERI